jgi:hypothetical protein
LAASIEKVGDDEVALDGFDSHIGGYTAPTLEFLPLCLISFSERRHVTYRGL